jgi:hypothetical protein
MNTLKQQKYQGTSLVNGKPKAIVTPTKWRSENALQKEYFQVVPSDIIGDIVKREFNKISVRKSD